MLSKETLENYRRMTPGERLALTFEMIREKACRTRSWAGSPSGPTASRDIQDVLFTQGELDEVLANRE